MRTGIFVQPTNGAALMTLLSTLSLHAQITYRPPTNAEIDKMEIEASEELRLQAMRSADEADELEIRFEFEVGRIKDLIATGSFWSMMQAADIYVELWGYLEGVDTPPARARLQELSSGKLGFPCMFWQAREDHFSWYNQIYDDPNDQLDLYYAEEELDDDDDCDPLAELAFDM